MKIRAKYKSICRKCDMEIHAGEEIEWTRGQIPYHGIDIYGGGCWFVIGADWIWAVKNNGRDGDCWEWNNVETSGAGAIGKRVTFDKLLATEIRTACATAYTK